MSEISNWCYTFIKVAYMTFSFINGSSQSTVTPVSAPCKCPAKAKKLHGSAIEKQCRGNSSVWSPWGCSGMIWCRRNANAEDTPWGHGHSGRVTRVTLRSPWTPQGLRLCKCHRLQRRSCGNHVRPHGVQSRSPCGALGDLTVLLLRCCCKSMAFPQRSHSDRCGNTEPQRELCACTECAPWHGILGDLTASSGNAMAMPQRSVGALGDPTAHTSAFRIFLGNHTVAVRTQSWCDRGFYLASGAYGFCGHPWSDELLPLLRTGCDAVHLSW